MFSRRDATTLQKLPQVNRPKNLLHQTSNISTRDEPYQSPQTQRSSVATIFTGVTASLEKHTGNALACLMWHLVTISPQQHRLFQGGPLSCTHQRLPLPVETTRSDPSSSSGTLWEQLRNSRCSESRHCSPASYRATDRYRAVLTGTRLYQTAPCCTGMYRNVASSTGPYRSSNRYRTIEAHQAVPAEPSRTGRTAEVRSTRSWGGTSRPNACARRAGSSISPPRVLCTVVTAVSPNKL